MMQHNHDRCISAIFITFPGNCKKALTFYQTCFGGLLQFQTFEKDLQDYIEQPVIRGSLVADRIIIHGSDLVHDEGRKVGNHMSIFLHCKNTEERKVLVEKLELDIKLPSVDKSGNDKLIEITDAFDVRWILGI